MDQLYTVLGGWCLLGCVLPHGWLPCEGPAKPTRLRMSLDHIKQGSSDPLCVKVRMSEGTRGSEHTAENGVGALGPTSQPGVFQKMRKRAPSSYLGWCGGSKACQSGFSAVRLCRLCLCGRLYTEGLSLSDPSHARDRFPLFAASVLETGLPHLAKVLLDLALQVVGRSGARGVSPSMS